MKGWQRLNSIINLCKIFCLQSTKVELVKKLVQNGLFEEEPGCSQTDKGVVTNTVKFYLYFDPIFNLTIIAKCCTFLIRFQKFYSSTSTQFSNWHYLLDVLLRYLLTKHLRKNLKTKGKKKCFSLCSPFANNCQIGQNSSQNWTLLKFPNLLVLFVV